MYLYFVVCDDRAMKENETGNWEKKNKEFWILQEWHVSVDAVDISVKPFHSLFLILCLYSSCFRFQHPNEYIYIYIYIYTIICSYRSVKNETVVVFFQIQKNDELKMKFLQNSRLEIQFILVSFQSVEALLKVLFWYGMKLYHHISLSFKSLDL